MYPVLLQIGDFSISSFGVMVALSFLVYREPLMGLPVEDIGLWLLCLAAVLTLWSMVIYLRVFWRTVKEAANPDGDRARTAYTIMEQAGRFAALVALAPFTGRTHQLRAHMAAIGHPILGDGKYGGEEATLPGMTLPKGMMLHARSLDVPAPAGGGRLFLEAEPPEAFQAALDAFGFAPETAGDPFGELAR